MRQRKSICLISRSLLFRLWNQWCRPMNRNHLSNSLKSTCKSPSFLRNFLKINSWMILSWQCKTSSRMSSNCPHLQDNIQIGDVIVLPDHSKVHSQIFADKIAASNPEAKLQPCASKKLLIEVPMDQANFFSSMINSPTHSSWAKDFLAANLTKHLNDWKGMVPLPIGNCFVYSPTLSRQKPKHWTPISIEEEELLLEEHEPEVPPWKRSKTMKEKDLLMETDVRRSPRVKLRNNGFKGAQCTRANCLGCSQTPPTLSIESIQKLGADTCQIDPAMLTKENQRKLKKKPGTVRKKSNKEANNRSKKDKGDDPVQEGEEEM